MEGTSAPVVLIEDDVLRKRRERREMQKSQREMVKLKKSKETAKSQKISLISIETYKKLQSISTKKATVKNKHLKACQSEFALTDFLVQKPDTTVKAHRKIPGTTVKSLKKGKVREVPKKKAVSRLKRAIIEIRRSRNVQNEDCNSLLPEQKIIQDSPPILMTESQCPPINYSRRFRSYCDHVNHPDISINAEQLLADLFRFQDRAYDKNQIKARAHRRYVVGFKEVERNMEIDKVKLLIIATDLEPSPGEGGLDEAVEKLKKICNEKNIPYCFPLPRRKVGYLLFKKAPISCVGILDYSGAENHVKALMQSVEKYRRSLMQQFEVLQIK